MFRKKPSEKQIANAYSDVEPCIEFLWSQPEFSDVVLKYTPAITDAIETVVNKENSLESLYQHCVNKKNSYAIEAGLSDIYNLRFCLDYLMVCLVASIPEKQPDVVERAFTKITVFICSASHSSDGEAFLSVLSKIVRNQGRLEPARRALERVKRIENESTSNTAFEPLSKEVSSSKPASEEHSRIGRIKLSDQADYKYQERQYSLINLLVGSLVLCLILAFIFGLFF